MMKADNDNQSDDELMVELTAQVVAAYVSNNVVPVAELGPLINSVHRTLSATTTVPEPVVVEKQPPAFPIKKSVQRDRIVCLECGLGFKSIRRHLSTRHGMTPKEYREKWHLPADYPVVARLCRSSVPPRKTGAAWPEAGSVEDRASALTNEKVSFSFGGDAQTQCNARPATAGSPIR